MSLHLLKLCVGCDSVESLEGWIAFRLAEKRRIGQPAEHHHVTRMVPRRSDELVDGGSLYWVIRGTVRVRQALTDIRIFTDGEGIRRCRLVLDPDLVRTVWQPRRPFQGWRYLRAEDAPADLAAAGERDDLPEAMAAELAALGVL